MHKFIAPLVFALSIVFAGQARAEQPCYGSSATCSWYCDQDEDGNITQYNVTCLYSDYCVDAVTNDWNFGTCDDVVDVPDPWEVIEAHELSLEKSLPVCKPK